MRFVSQSVRVAAAAACVAGSACSLSVGDPVLGTPIEIKLDFCTNDTPIWLAFQDGSAAFDILTPDASGTFTFTAHGLVTLAYVRQRGTDYRTDILFTTNVALAPLSGLTCQEHGGAKQLGGTVTGHTGIQAGRVSLSTASVAVPAGSTAWTLSQLVDRPLDLIASRVEVNADGEHSGKTIIRRSQNATSGSTFPALNFDAEGFAPGQTTVTLSGIGANDHATLYNTFQSALGTSHTMTFADNVVDGPELVETVPVGEMSGQEFHKALLTSTAPNGAVRITERYFRTPEPLVLTLGPPLIEPSITLVGRNPHVRLRTQVQGQIDYSTMVNMLYHQQLPAGAIDVSMSVTASYFSGTPIEWNLPMPDFNGLAGWQTAWGLKPGNIDWRVTAYYGRPQLAWGAPPNALVGETIAYGSRSSSTTVTPAVVGAGRVVDHRPGHFGTFVPSGPR